MTPATCETVPGPGDAVNHPCDICGCVDGELTAGTDGGDYVRCRGCECEKQTHNETAGSQASFECEQQKHYDADSLCFSPFLQSLHRKRAAQRIAVVRRYLAGGRLLEVGPGSGDVLAAARNAGFSAEGIEHSAALADRIRRYCDAPVHVGAFEELELEPSSYDGWLSYHVIEHVPEPFAHVKRAAEVVRPGGYAFLATPSAESWEHRLCGRCSQNYSTAHLRLFSSRGLGLMFEAAGWEVVEIRTFSYAEAWLRVLTAMRRRLRPSSGKRIARGAYVRNTSPRIGAAVVTLCAVPSWPARRFQDLVRRGNELHVVARRR